MKQIFDSYGNHKLVADDGRETGWANYTAFTYLDGWVGVTDYYTGSGETILTMEAFCSAIGVGPKP